MTHPRGAPEILWSRQARNHVHVLLLRRLRGFGVHASRPFAAGETVLVFAGDVLDISQALRHPECENLLQLGPDRYMLCDAPGRFVNHSCSPNCRIEAEVRLVALRRIAAGEEVTFDYQPTMLDGLSPPFTCRCGDPSCRGRIPSVPSNDA